MVLLRGDDNKRAVRCLAGVSFAMFVAQPRLVRKCNGTQLSQRFAAPQITLEGKPCSMKACQEPFVAPKPSWL